MKFFIIFVCVTFAAAGLVSDVEELALIEYGPFGGNGGNYFSDSDYSAAGNISRIDVRHGNHLDGIQITYGYTQGPFHGGNGGDPGYFNVTSDEVVSRVELYASDRIDGIQFTTDTGRNSSWFGAIDGEYYLAYSAGQLLFITGSSGEFIDAMSFWVEV